MAHTALYDKNPKKRGKFSQAPAPIWTPPKEKKIRQHKRMAMGEKI